MMGEGFNHYIDGEERPLYLQIKEEIRMSIISGEFPLGSRLPSVRELSVRYHCSVITTKRVYQDLAREGYLQTSQGTGTFVSADVQFIARDKERLVTEALQQAVDRGVKLGYSVDQLQVMFQNAVNTQFL